MRLWSFTDEKLEDILDQGKVLILEALVAEGLVVNEDADGWAQRHTIILKKKPFFRTLTGLWKKVQEDPCTVMLVASLVGLRSHHSDVDKSGTEDIEEENHG